MQVPIGNMVVGIDFDGADEALPCFGQSCLVIQQIAIIVVCGGELASRRSASLNSISA